MDPTPTPHPALVAALAALALVVWAAPVSAQDSRVVLDYFVGPVISSGRVVGMGGAFISVAEGADGHLVNPASFAVRYAYAGDAWFDWDYALSWVNVGVGSSTELDRSGRDGTYDSAFTGQFGANIKLGRHGFGVHTQNQEFEVKVETPDGEVGLVYTLSLGGAGYAYPFLDGDLTLGVLGTTGRAELASSAGGGAVEGGGLLFGALWAPCGTQYRLGAVLQTPILGAQRTVGEGAEGLIPDALSVPGQLGLGWSAMWGPRRYNFCPTWGDWEDVSELPPPRTFRRRYLLVSADLVLTGTTTDGAGALAFLAGTVQPSGRELSASPRLGVESEIWDDLIVVRGGSYWEPSRFSEHPGRLHGTAGFDVKLFELFWLWKASFVADLAPRYTNIGVGLGLWH